MAICGSGGGPCAAGVPDAPVPGAGCAGCGCPSASVKSRPSAICPPINRKKFVVTSAQRICSGDWSARGTVARPVLTAPSSSNTPAVPLRRSRKLALEGGEALKLGFRLVDARHRGAAGVDGAQFFEHARGAVAQVEEVGVGEREVFDIALPHVRNSEGQPVWVLVRKRPQQHGVGYAEDGRAGSDPQRDGDDSGSGKHWTLGQGPRRVREVSQQHPCTSGIQDSSRKLASKEAA